MTSHQGQAHEPIGCGLALQLRPLFTQTGPCAPLHAGEPLRSARCFKNIIQGASGAFGNAATRVQAFVVNGGTYVYGSYPDIDALFEQQARELDGTKRAGLLDKIQELANACTIYAHIWQLAFLNGAGPRVSEMGLGLIAGRAYSAPNEDLTLAGK
jgi:peptide/nickel transport system substrate-binding protein